MWKMSVCSSTIVSATVKCTNKTEDHHRDDRHRPFVQSATDMHGLIEQLLSMRSLANIPSNCSYTTIHGIFIQVLADIITIQMIVMIRTLQSASKYTKAINTTYVCSSKKYFSYEGVLLTVEISWNCFVT